MGAAHDFLARVLPEDGYKCALVLDAGLRRQEFFETTEELADYVLEQDALEHTVYHACASFKTVGRRTGENALGSRAFWLDVDARTTHADAHYEDAVEAAHAASVFCRSIGLPAPIYTSSGGGIYLHWPLVEILGAEVWRSMANRLKQLCDENGLHADRVRTGDISSVLRTPGTHNRKNGAVVQCGPLVGPYAIEQFEVLNVSDVPSRVQYAVVSPRRSLIDAALVLSLEGGPSDPALASQRCRQLGRFVERLGNIPEPDWYAGVEVYAHCQDGDRFAQEHSTGHPTYSFGETQGRLDRARGYGPTTCAHFQALNPLLCEGCAYLGTITSPIQLGRRLPGEAVEESNGEESEEADEALPKGYLNNGQGLVYMHEGKGGVLTPKVVSPYGVELVSVQTGEADATVYSMVFAHALPKGRRYIEITNKAFFGAAGMSEMMGKGLIVHEPDMMKGFVRSSLEHWHKDKDTQYKFDQFGWKEDNTAFLWGRKLYTPSGIVEVSGSDEVNYRAKMLGPKGGSLDEWRRAANRLFAAGFEPQSIGLLCGFAAPLMRFHGTTEGGAIFSTVSDRTAGGKSTALEAAASVWGQLRGTQLVDEDTKVAKGLKLGIYGNLPCTYDELAQRDPELIRQFVLLFTGGVDRDRGTTQGTLIHTKSEWQTILLLASNKPLVDILSSIPGASSAPSYRLLEFQASLPEGTDKPAGDAMRRAFFANAGHAGDAYLRYLVKPEVIEYVKQAIPIATQQVWEQTKLNNDFRFWVRTVASIIVAGTIVEQLGILDFSVPRITTWLFDHMRRSAMVIGGDQDQRSEVGLLSQFLHEHREDTLIVNREWRQRVPAEVLQPPKNKLYVRIEREPQRCLILYAKLREWLLTKNVHRAAFEYSLMEKKVITNPRKWSTLGAGTMWSAGQVECVEIDMGVPLMSGVAREVYSSGGEKQANA